MTLAGVGAFHNFVRTSRRICPCASPNPNSTSSRFAIGWLFDGIGIHTLRTSYLEQESVNALPVLLVYTLLDFLLGKPCVICDAGVGYRAAAEYVGLEEESLKVVVSKKQSVA